MPAVGTYAKFLVYLTSHLEKLGKEKPEYLVSMQIRRGKAGLIIQKVWAATTPGPGEDLREH